MPALDLALRDPCGAHAAAIDALASFLSDVLKEIAFRPGGGAGRGAVSRRRARGGTIRLRGALAAFGRGPDGDGDRLAGRLSG
jgi:hypothetical protein